MKSIIFLSVFAIVIHCNAQTDTTITSNFEVLVNHYSADTVLSVQSTRVFGFHGFLFGQLKYDYSITGGVFEYEKWAELRKIGKKWIVVRYYPNSVVVKSKIFSEVYLCDMIYAGAEVLNASDSFPGVRHYTSVSTRPHGRYIEWYPNGSIKVVGYYRHGLKEKKWKYYDENGRLHDVVYWQFNEEVKK